MSTKVWTNPKDVEVFLAQELQCRERKVRALLRHVKHRCKRRVPAKARRALYNEGNGHFSPLIIVEGCRAGAPGVPVPWEDTRFLAYLRQLNEEEHDPQHRGQHYTRKSTRLH